MEENAMISLKTVQYAVDGEEDTIELVTKGKFAQHDGKFYIIYQESEITGFDDTTTTIKISDGQVVLSRKGKFNSRMEFVKNEKRLCNYPTPYGNIPVAVNPVEINSDISLENGGSLKLEYILDIANKAYARNKLELNVKYITKGQN